MASGTVLPLMIDASPTAGKFKTVTITQGSAFLTCIFAGFNYKRRRNPSPPYLAITKYFWINSIATFEGRVGNALNGVHPRIMITFASTTA